MKEKGTGNGTRRYGTGESPFIPSVRGVRGNAEKHRVPSPRGRNPVKSILHSLPLRRSRKAAPGPGFHGTT